MRLTARLSNLTGQLASSSGFENRVTAVVVAKLIEEDNVEHSFGIGTRLDQPRK